MRQLAPTGLEASSCQLAKGEQRHGEREWDGIQVPAPDVPAAAYCQRTIEECRKAEAYQRDGARSAPERRPRRRHQHCAEKRNGERDLSALVDVAEDVQVPRERGREGLCLRAGGQKRARNPVVDSEIERERREPERIVDPTTKGLRPRSAACEERDGTAG